MGTLEEDSEGIWRYKPATLSKPIEEIFIKGEIKSIHKPSMSVTYGINGILIDSSIMSGLIV